jgi:hypothetical protein
MPISSNYKDLFRNATTDEKLTLFQVLLNAKEDMTADLALALLKIIHKELSVTHQARDRSGYKRYAEAIEALRFYMSDIFKKVMNAPKSQQNAIPSDWFSHEGPNN